MWATNAILNLYYKLLSSRIDISRYSFIIIIVSNRDTYLDIFIIVCPDRRKTYKEDLVISLNSFNLSPTFFVSNRYEEERVENIYIVQSVYSIDQN